MRNATRRNSFRPTCQTELRAQEMIRTSPLGRGLCGVADAPQRVVTARFFDDARAKPRASTNEVLLAVSASASEGPALRASGYERPGAPSPPRSGGVDLNAGQRGQKLRHLVVLELPLWIINDQVQSVGDARFNHGRGHVTLSNLRRFALKFVPGPKELEVYLRGRNAPLQ